MPGTVIIVKPLTPKRNSGQRVEVTASKPDRPARQRQIDHAFENQREGAPRKRVHRAHGDCARNVGRAVKILPAAIYQQQFTRFDGAVCRFGHAVMHDGTVGPGTADRVKRYVQQGVGGAASCLQLLGDINLGQRAFRSLGVQPAQKFGHRTGIAQMGGTGRLDLGIGFAGFGQNTRVLDPFDLCASLFQQGVGAAGKRAFLKPDHTFQRQQRRAEIVEMGDADIRAEMCANVRTEFFWIAEDRNAPICVDDRKGQNHRVLRDIGTANIQQPRDRIGQGDRTG